MTRWPWWAILPVAVVAGAVLAVLLIGCHRVASVFWRDQEIAPAHRFEDYHCCRWADDEPMHCLHNLNGLQPCETPAEDCMLLPPVKGGSGPQRVCQTPKTR